MQDGPDVPDPDVPDPDVPDPDVIVIGGGHAGCEAAAAAARAGARVWLVTQRRDTIGALSCNPAIGGLGKGHLVREIDALDGLMGRVTDAAGIQFRLLNRSRGPAVRGPRAQVDRRLYAAAMARALADTPGLHVRTATVEDLIVERTAGRVRVTGVVTADGARWRAGAVVLTTGTFLGGMIHVGDRRLRAGRAGEAPVLGLTRTLRGLNLRLGRLKTGTPPRLDRASIAWAGLPEQPGDEDPQMLSVLSVRPMVPQVCCHITATTPATHAIIAASLHQAPSQDGRMGAPGPRYCPSIEDKVVRFPERTGHQIFLEPEGLQTDLIYPNGISTSLPASVQEAFVRTVPGLAHAVLRRPGYAIAYDHVDPQELWPSLELRKAQGLFLAGQINGTTGYEEAAAQGLAAGLNAARAAGGLDPVIFDRARAYIGVLIDDLITKGVTEPYRMFTSRAEYRLTLRADNADLRLTPLAMTLGLAGACRRRSFSARAARLAAGRALVHRLTLTPDAARRLGLAVTRDGVRRSAARLLGAPGIDVARLAAIWPELNALAPDVRVQLEADACYAGYMERQEADIRAFRKEETLRLPANLDYGAVPGLATEARQKLAAARPWTLGQAARLEGVTPATLSALLMHVKNPAHRNLARNLADVSRETPA